MDQAIRDAAAELVDKLDKVSDSPEYKAVWSIFTARGGIYTGPDYAEEVKTLRRLLGLSPGETTPAYVSKTKLYKVKNLGSETFFVVAEDESQAARLAEKTWVEELGYRSAEAPAVMVELVATNAAYPGKGKMGVEVAWLLIPGSPLT